MSKFHCLRQSTSQRIYARYHTPKIGYDLHKYGSKLKVLPWVVDGAGGLGAGKTSGAGTRGVDLNAAIGGRTGYTDTNGGESSNNGSKIHFDCYPAENPSL